MPNVDLPPELASYVEGCVASGRFGGADEVLAEAVRLMREGERWREELGRSLDDAVREAEEVGEVSWEVVDAEMGEIIARAERRVAEGRIG